MAADIAVELKEFNVTSVSLCPGPVKSELYSDEVGMVSRDTVAKTYANAESIEFPGKCVVALASDPNLIQKTGHILLTMELAKEYGLHDEDGRMFFVVFTVNFCCEFRTTYLSNCMQIFGLYQRSKPCSKLNFPINVTY